MARLYADENFSALVAAELRDLGHDVRTVQEAGRRGLDDATVLADAVADARAVVTYNRRHFVRLHWQTPDHRGVIVCTDDPDASALAHRIDGAITVAGSLDRMLLRINRPAVS